jgi:hypothetical protein
LPCCWSHLSPGRKLMSIPVPASFSSRSPVRCLLARFLHAPSLDADRWFDDQTNSNSSPAVALNDAAENRATDGNRGSRFSNRPCGRFPSQSFTFGKAAQLRSHLGNDTGRARVSSAHRWTPGRAALSTLPLTERTDALGSGGTSHPAQSTSRVYQSTAR